MFTLVLSELLLMPLYSTLSTLSLFWEARSLLTCMGLCFFASRQLVLLAKVVRDCAESCRRASSSSIMLPPAPPVSRGAPVKLFYCNLIAPSVLDETDLSSAV